MTMIIAYRIAKHVRNDYSVKGDFYRDTHVPGLEDLRKMILVQCIKNVYGEAVEASLILLEKRLLFKANHFYMVGLDPDGHLVTQDEEGEPHIIADSREGLNKDSWFCEHFMIA